MKAIGLLSSACLLIPNLVFAQAQVTPTVIPNATFTAEYPNDRAGVFIQKIEWQEVSSVTPTKTRARHAIAASLSYGAVPANLVSEYEGAHAAVEVPAGLPVICICHLLSLPGDPVIVRLHPKKNLRELDGGKMIVYPVVGGSKAADANSSDLISVDVAKPDAHVWLIRPQAALAAGEYALMLGTKNVAIFPFTVAEAPTPAERLSEKK
jgi:hypothetical protein